MSLQQQSIGSPLALFLDDTILELLPVAVCVCDPEGAVVRFNRKAEQLWGQAPEAEQHFCGSFRYLTPGGRSLPRERTPMAEVLRTGIPAQDLEVHIERPDGARLWLLANIEPIFDARGNVGGAINCFQDITARYEAERELRESKAFLEAVVEATPECIKRVAADGTLMSMNSAGLRMIEAPHAAAVANSCVFDLIAPEDREAWKQEHDHVCAGERRTWEFDMVGLGGTRRHMETHAVPLPGPDGSLLQLAVTRDVTQRKIDQTARAATAKRLDDLLQALPMAVYMTDADGRITFYNEAAADFWGRRPELGKEEWCGSEKLFDAKGAPLPHDQCPMAAALKEKRRVRNVEAYARRPDGTMVPFTPFPTPLYDAEGNLAGAVNVLIDISRHKQASERQQLLINELNHRVKNTLAAVQSIVAMTLNNTTSPEEFQSSLEGRLIALSRAHDLLTQESWQRAGLEEILSQELATYDGTSGKRVSLCGARLALPPQLALTLAMAFHELTTNAAKYGALSVSEGRVDVSWRLTQTELQISWAENGGPTVKEPTRKGFGTRLIQRSISRELSGKALIAYEPAGVRCEISIPLRSNLKFSG